MLTYFKIYSIKDEFLKLLLCFLANSHLTKTSTRNRAGFRDTNEVDYVKYSMRQIMLSRGFVDYFENREHTDRFTDMQGWL
jgi:hypothetical protein